MCGRKQGLDDDEPLLYLDFTSSDMNRHVAESHKLPPALRLKQPGFQQFQVSKDLIRDITLLLTQLSW